MAQIIANNTTVARSDSCYAGARLASGKTWPKVPPNDMASRYDGRLQSIHHVDDRDFETDISILKLVNGEARTAMNSGLCLVVAAMATHAAGPSGP